MDQARLQSMLEQIARNLSARGYDRAVAGTADHVEAFWDSRMKQALFASDLTQLSPLPRAAAERLAVGNIPEYQAGVTKLKAGNKNGDSDAG